MLNLKLYSSIKQHSFIIDTKYSVPFTTFNTVRLHLYRRRKLFFSLTGAKLVIRRVRGGGNYLRFITHHCLFSYKTTELRNQPEVYIHVVNLSTIQRHECLQIRQSERGGMAYHSHSCPVFQRHPVRISSCYRGWGFSWDCPHEIQDSRPTTKHDSFASHPSSSETTLSHSGLHKPTTASLNGWNFDRVTLQRNVCMNQPVFEVLLSFVNLGIWETVTLYAFIWVIPRGLNFIRQRFGTLCSIFTGGLWRWNRHSVPKRWHIKFRQRGITQKKAYRNQE
jgi:hypothetical protein